MSFIYFVQHKSLNSSNQIFKNQIKDLIGQFDMANSAPYVYCFNGIFQN